MPLGYSHLADTEHIGDLLHGHFIPIIHLYQPAFLIVQLLHRFPQLLEVEPMENLILKLPTAVLLFDLNRFKTTFTQMSAVGAFFSSLTLAVGFHEFVQFVRNFYNLILDSYQPDLCTSFRCGKVHIPDTAEAVNAHESDLSRRMVA